MTDITPICAKHLHLMKEVLYDSSKLKDVDHAFSELCKATTNGDGSRGYRKAYLVAIERCMYGETAAKQKTAAYERYLEVLKIFNKKNQEEVEAGNHPE